MSEGIPEVLAKLGELSGKLDEIIIKVGQIIDILDDMKMSSYVICTVCHGIGTIIPSHDQGLPPPPPIMCPGCNGAGRVKLGEQEVNGVT